MRRLLIMLCAAASVLAAYSGETTGTVVGSTSSGPDWRFYFPLYVAVIVVIGVPLVQIGALLVWRYQQFLAEHEGQRLTVVRRKGFWREGYSVYVDDALVISGTCRLWAVESLLGRSGRSEVMLTPRWTLRSGGMRFFLGPAFPLPASAIHLTIDGQVIPFREGTRESRLKGPRPGRAGRPEQCPDCGRQATLTPQGRCPDCAQRLGLIGGG